VARIERRFVGGFTVQTHLDRYDIAMILIAGLTGALVDYLIMGSPTSLAQLRDFKPDDSPLTRFFHAHRVDSDNRLGDVAHAPFDAQTYKRSGARIPGFSPDTHRDLTLGHDPLLGLVFGTMDIMKGTVTTFGPAGQRIVLQGSHAAVANPFAAVAIEVAHLLSDAFTPDGLPAPGWTAANVLQFGSLGANNETVAKDALKMYEHGYDSRHFLTMSATVCAVELVLRAYWSLRNEFDPEYAEDLRREAEIACSSGIGDHPRYEALAFGAHAVAAAANAGKVALAGGNTLVVNYPEWLRFIEAATKFGRGRAVSPTDVLVRRGLGNAEALSRGWPDLDVDDPEFPSIRLSSPT